MTKMKNVSGGTEGVENGELVKSQNMQGGVYQSWKCHLGAEGNEAALKGLSMGTLQSDQCFQNN